jgi:small membrane protein
MKNIQILLLTMLVVGTVLFFTRNRTRLIDRIFVLAFVLAGAVLVSFPELSDRLASLLSVGRGVDAVMYFMLVFLSYTCLQLYAKIRSQDARIVDLARFIALNSVKLPESMEDSMPNVLPGDLPGDLPSVLRIADARKERESEWIAAAEAEAESETQSFAKAG